MRRVRFFTKLNCPECDQAYLMLVTAALDTPLEIDILDITHSHHGLELAAYATRIPVIVTENNSKELAWPFTQGDVQAYLEEVL